jgi:uncharacterized protein YodC (DUF2158 family)
MNTFNIGEIVRFKAYNIIFAKKGSKDSNKNEDKDFVPNMVVLETINDKNANQFSTLTGGQKSSTFKYKCLWYHSKSRTFKEELFDALYLEKVELKQEGITLICFEDLKNQQLGFNCKLKGENIGSFEPPVMLLIDVILNKEKSTSDRETKEPIRKVAEHLAKCKWYNPKENKFSEHLFPLEALVKL